MGGTTLAMHALVRVFAGRVVVMVVHRTARRQQTGGEHNGTCEIAHTHTCATKQSKSARDAPVVAGTVSKRVCCAHKMSTPEVPIAQRIAEVQANMAEAARCGGIERYGLENGLDQLQPFLTPGSSIWVRRSVWAGSELRLRKVRWLMVSDAVAT